MQAQEAVPHHVDVEETGVVVVSNALMWQILTNGCFSDVASLLLLVVHMRTLRFSSGLVTSSMASLNGSRVRSRSVGL